MSLDLRRTFTYPYPNDLLLRKQKSLRRQLLARENISYTPIKIALLCGSTADDIKNVLELFLLASNIKPAFFQSEYNKFYEDAVFGNAELESFSPEIVIVFTGAVNIVNIPTLNDSDSDIQKKITAEMERFLSIWKALENKYHAVIIQNNFEFPAATSLGNLAATLPIGICRFIQTLNERFADYANSHDNFYLHDFHGLSAKIGLSKWHNPFQYCVYKFAMNYDVMPEVSLSLAKIIRAVLGKTKKCLVLDLDNTLWGGVIGDDGMEGIKIGHETPAAEAYTVFQEYVLKLKQRGIILAVCSKNDDHIARSGFEHPDSVLHLDDFVSFRANWKPKDLNIVDIAQEINIGLDSLVFLDDNPAERQLVRDSLPEVAVPEIDGEDVFSFIRAIEEAGYFEPITISEDDRKRNDTYRENKARQAFKTSCASYDDFLQSLSMQAEIDSFRPVYFDRIAQLTGKTNQFNLTARRYTKAQIEQMSQSSRYITLYGRLTDKFGDNGLISVVIGEKKAGELHILLWLMSCRVLKRGVEAVMLDTLVERAKDAGCKKIVGYYYPTKKNKMVEDLYSLFGFTCAGKDDGGTIWEMATEDFKKCGKYIAVKSFCDR